MPDWNTRLEVRLGDAVVAPISQFTPTFNVPAHRHPLDRGRQRRLRAAAADLHVHDDRAGDRHVRRRPHRAGASTGQEFEITVAEKKGTDWAFKALKFTRCVITSANPSNVVIDGAPQRQLQLHVAQPGDRVAVAADDELDERTDDEAEEIGVAVMPSFQFGGRVERTGIALVHEGEYVMPAPGSEAVVSPPGAGPHGQPVTWSFPVEVEVVGELSEDHLRRGRGTGVRRARHALRGIGCRMQGIAGTKMPETPGLDCVVPIRVRLVGTPTAADLMRLEEAVARLIGRRLEQANRALAGPLPAAATASDVPAARYEPVLDVDPTTDAGGTGGYRTMSYQAPPRPIRLPVTRSGGEAQQAALRRITKLLSTGILDWAVTDAEAREVLRILGQLAPEDLLKAVQTHAPERRLGHPGAAGARRRRRRTHRAPAAHGPERRLPHAR